MNQRKRRLGKLFALAMTAIAVSVAPPASAAESGVLADTDVYIRDFVGDNGTEPHGNPVWTSPDIKVCPTTTECPTSVNPEVGQTNYIFVRLNNPGPYGSGPDVGNLEVYRSTPGGGSAWTWDWTSIGAQFGVAVPTGGATVMIPWNGVPGPGHFCLLARWYSANDPMTYPETVDTVLNTQKNNNIAWRNVDSVDLFAGEPQERPYAIGNPGPTAIATDLAFTDVRAGFIASGGKLVVDLGPTVFGLWREGGGRATGVKQVGTYSFEITDFRQAKFIGIRLAPKTRPAIKLLFSTTTTPRKGAHVVRVNQIAPVAGQSFAAPIDVGGVEYQVNIK